MPLFRGVLLSSPTWGWISVSQRPSCVNKNLEFRLDCGVLVVEVVKVLGIVPMVPWSNQ